ncbi:MAG: lactoylglutathione lyase [Lysobacteraceae bacterium]|nr:MAG: lactoylglutathione lyase [Xanthomonadaceae bacterium]
MSRMLFASLPVTDLKASIAFYEGLGFTNNAQFTDETATCMVWSESVFVMVLTHEKWRSFTTRPIPPPTSSELMLALTFDSRAEVDAFHDAAVRGGGTPDVNPIGDYGFMYSRSTTDLDGHLWEAVWMDMEAMAAQQPPAAA